eukprot:m.65960 g.65960  ORF g.65960 m.65960 type:complete len:460 (+) comp35349_c0_seq6:765-2144(+)
MTSCGVPWLDSCLSETLLPISPWKSIKEIAFPKLAACIEPYLDRPALRQMIFHLLGDDFVKKFMTKWTDEPQLIQQPYMEAPYYKETEALARRLLSDISHQILAGDEMSVAKADFKVFTKDLVSDRADQELARMAGQGHPYSETLGSAVECLLDKHSCYLNHICGRLTGKVLPQTLRSKIWTLKIDEIIHNLGEQDSGVRSMRKRCEEFTAGVRDQLECLLPVEHEPALQSPLAHLICQTVEKACLSVVGWPESSAFRSCCDVLNILYIYNKSYEPIYAYLVIPVVQALTGDHDSMKIAWVFWEILLYCLPTPATIATLADNIMKSVLRSDPSLYHHMIQTAKENSAGYHEDFLVNLVAKEGGTVSGLANPVLAIRKWITQGFVDVLSRSILMFVWDQLFLSNWNLVQIKELCLTLIDLIKSDLMNAKDYQELLMVFLRSPSKIDLPTLAGAWIDKYAI